MHLALSAVWRAAGLTVAIVGCYYRGVASNMRTPWGTRQTIALLESEIIQLPCASY